MRFRPNLETLETREAPGGVSIAQVKSVDGDSRLATTLRWNQVQADSS